MKTCEDCIFLLKWDSGYSDYTIECTMLYCVKEANKYLKGGGVEEPYGKHPIFDEAWGCAAFKAGGCQNFNVEWKESEIDYYDPEFAEAFKSWNKK